MIPRAEKDYPDPNGFKTRVTHYTSADGTCLGLHVILWCPGCQQMHGPTFECDIHGRPASGPVWDGDPRSDPFSFEPSLLVQGGPGSVCHSFVRNGIWDFLSDSTHALAGQQVPLEVLPHWIVRASN